MKDLFERYEDKLQPQEDARVWNAMRDARRSEARPRPWRIPAAIGLGATAVIAVAVLQNMETDPVTESLVGEAVMDAVREPASSEELSTLDPRGDLGAAEIEAAPKQRDQTQDRNNENESDVGNKPRVAGGLELTPALREQEASKDDRKENPTPTYHPVPSQKLKKLPMDNLDIATISEEAVEQGGNKHFRGGRSGEVKTEDAGIPSADSPQAGVGLTLPEAPTGPMIHPGAPPLSTGGSSPVNDAAYDAMFFKNYGVNPFVSVEDDPLSTFAMDVDNASYTLIRSYLERGHVPPAEAVRVEEIINAFDHQYPAPQGDLLVDASGTVSKFGTFAIYLDGGPSPFQEKNTLVRVGLKAREISPEQRKPASLTFVVDVSGSMNREDRLELVKRSLKYLLTQLKPEDRVGLVVYGTRARTLLPSTALNQRWVIEQAIDALQPEGATNAEAGLVEGYRLAKSGFVEGANNRVILCSDGVANVGNTGAEGILQRIKDEAESGIALTTIGFGMGNYNDVLMEQLANQGDGSYFYIDRFEEATRVFGKELTGTLETVAKESKIQVEFLGDAVDRYRLLGYENRDVADKDFRNDSVDAGEVGAGHEVTTLYDLRLESDLHAESAVAVVRIRYEDPRTGEVVEESRVLKVKHLQSDWESTSASFKMDASLAAFGEHLRGSYWVKEMNPNVPHQLAAQAAPGLSEQQSSRFAQARRLMEQYAALAEERTR